jgi:hypothetical protein
VPASAHPAAILAVLLACASSPLWAQALDDQARQPLPASVLRPAACPLDARQAPFALREPACRALQSLPSLPGALLRRHIR